MKLVESKCEIVPQESGILGAYKQIEKAGRVCYKSEDKIKEGSAKKMVDFLVSKGHGSPLEHGTIYLKMFVGFGEGPFEFYKENPYSVVNIRDGYAYITTNCRVLVENDWLEDLKYICEPTEHHERRITVKFILSRSIANEFVRHRSMSFCQESQRYVNYSLDKFGNEITFILPQWVINRTNDIAETYDPLTGYKRDYLMDMPIIEAVTKHMVCEDRAVSNWVDSLKKAESDYFYLLSDECGLKPQEARGVLPNDCKTELMMTGFIKDWKHFFKLRTSNTAHPDAMYLARMVESNFKLNNLI